MNAIKIVLVIAVLIGGWYGWNHLPGLRTKVEGAVDRYGGWTEEARREDPVGFITFAEEKLAEDLVEFRKSRIELGAAKQNAVAEKERNGGLSQLADQLAAEFKGAYKGAQGSSGAQGAWPVDVRGASYDEPALVEQVDKILADKASYEKVLVIYQDVIETATARDKELKDRIQTTEATLDELRAKKELVKVEKMTAEADELLAQIEELLGKTAAAPADSGTPVRSVEELMTSAKSAEAQHTAANTTALDFLNAQ